MACGHVSGRKRPAQGMVPVIAPYGGCHKRPGSLQDSADHGYVVDGEGRKMSKSLGNGIDPEDVIKEYGADI